MATLQERVTALAQAVGADMHTVLGRSPIFGSGPPDARATIVGSAQATGSTLLVPFSVEAGDTVVVGYKTEGPVDASSCTDSLGSSYSSVVSVAGEANNAAMYTAQLDEGSEALTIAIASPGNDFDKVAVLVVRGATGEVLSSASLFTAQEAALNRLPISVAESRSFHVLLWAGFRNANVVAMQEPFYLSVQGGGAGAIALGSAFRTTPGDSAAITVTTEGFPDNQVLLLAAFAVVAAEIDAPEGTLYFDLTAEPGQSYVMYQGVWHALGGAIR